MRHSVPVRQITTCFPLVSATRSTQQSHRKRGERHGAFSGRGNRNARIRQSREGSRKRRHRYRDGAQEGETPVCRRRWNETSFPRSAPSGDYGLSEGGASDATMMALAGHMSREMLEHYSHVRMAAKRTALDRLGDASFCPLRTCRPR